MSEEKTGEDINPIPEPVRESTIDVYVSTLPQAADSASTLPPYAPTTFSSPQAFGQEHITDYQLLFSSQREPILKWITYHTAVDIFDNWFRVVDPKKPEDTALDDAVQRILLYLNAKQNLIRFFTFERRYGTAIFLCGYTNLSNWTTPVYETSNGLNRPMNFTAKGSQLLQITPYPWHKVTVDEVDKNDSSFRYGLPETYTVQRGTSSEQGSVGAETDEKKIHWSRVIHGATRLDENGYEGESVQTPVWDDAVGGRNIRWGQYELFFRVGGGFPWFHFPNATRKQVEDFLSSGTLSRFNARGFFVSGGEGETIEFIGPKGVTLNPEPYNEMWFNNIAMATRIPKDMLKGASAGTVAGSEVNERSYWNFIKSEQAMVEPIVRELIDRLFDTGQVVHPDGRRKFSKDQYNIIWNYPEIVSEKDRATIDFLNERMKAQSSEYLTVNEIRGKEGLPPVEGGDIVLGILKATKTQSFQGAESSRPSAEQRRPTEQVEEGYQESKA